ncbi:hypothetical protein AMATHDRAFT_64627 [Amanita thiersii Skay4041]|uniref:Protein kinase domain-containing protein n=1 Tax=Amanita thiersii Skay4041 TaxID=703135 RepID=A0A2A9NHJ6_9AGAR|nr:hypothetical protein AMATHDRAFT_64627 [Amanita thiersii Skay4041]
MDSSFLITRSISAVGRIDDAFVKWRSEDSQTPPDKSPSGWWNKGSQKRKETVPQEPLPGWKQTGQRVVQAAASVLGNTKDVAHEVLSTGVDLLELAPLPGLAPAARTLLEIWNALETVDMNRTACLRLTERCAEILLSVREEIREAGDVVGEDLAVPIAKLVESFAQVHSLLQKLNRRPFIKRYLKRDEILRQIAECDKALTDALGMFSLSIQLRILRQIQASETQRQLDTRAILDSVISASSPSNALRLSGVQAVEETTVIPSSSTPSQLSPVSLSQDAGDSSNIVASPSAVQGPLLAVNDVPHLSLSPARVLPALREIHSRQNTLDAAKDTTDLRLLMSRAIQTSSDAQLLDILQITRDEMPEAIKTLQRALEKLIERENVSDVSASEGGAQSPPEPSSEPPRMDGRPGFFARRMTLKSFKGQETPNLKRSKTVASGASKETNAASSKSSETRRVRDTLDREFIESGLDALRRMSRGLETTLPSWTITRYEVDREVKIGMGFFSDVYKGKWRGRTVAIKVLAETTPRKLFVNEVEIWKSLHHPNVLELYGASSATSDPPWFFVSPYTKHGSLPQYLRQLILDSGGSPHSLTPPGSISHRRRSSPGRRLDESPHRDSLSGSLGSNLASHDRPLGISGIPKQWNLYRFMHEIAKGMEYLHNVKVIRGDVEVCGILHGDLKAANVLVDDQFHCVISDFGQSEMKSEAYRISGMPLPHGTLRWQAPELMAGACDLTPAMDVYAFAICCVEILLMGRMPWLLHDDNDVRRFVLDWDQRPSIPDNAPFNSAALRELIQSCWARDPSQRPAFTNIVQELKFIRRNAGQNPDEVHTPSKPEAPQDERSSRPSPDMRPVALPAIPSRSSEEVRRPHHSLEHTHVEDAVSDENHHRSQHVLYSSTEPSSRASSLFTHTASSSEESLLFLGRSGYESPAPHDNLMLERKNEMRYRMLLNHDFHRSLILPLWRPSLIKLGAVGYLSRPSGQFVTLFNAFAPERSPLETVKNLPSLHGYGKVVCGSQREDKRNAALRGLDLIAGLLTFRNTESRSVSRRHSFSLRSGHKSAYLCTETTIYRYMEKLDAPKRWFKANVDRILAIFSSEHLITKEDLFLIIGTLNSPDYALFVSHKHPDSQVHFNVFSAPRNGQPWGMFTTETGLSPRSGGPDYEETNTVAPLSSSHISTVGDGWHSVLLARLRFKPDISEPTSL